jgi:hypothetical protein
LFAFSQAPFHFGVLMMLNFLSVLRAGAATTVLALAVQPGTAAAAASEAFAPRMTGRFATEVTEGFSEIVAYHRASQSVFITVDTDRYPSQFRRVGLRALGQAALSNPVTDSNLEAGSFTDVAADVNQPGVFTAGGVQSLAISDNLLAIAVQATNKPDNGVVAFYQLDAKGQAKFLKKVTVGSLPDGVAFTPNGQHLVVANEGELSKQFAKDGIDPMGTVSVIRVNNHVPADTALTLDFTAFDAGNARAAELPKGVRIGRAGNLFSKDVEPEYVSISADSATAYVTLQENNAVAMIKLQGNQPRIEKIVALGEKDHGASANALATSDRAEPPFTLRSYANLRGLYLPDGIATYTVDGTPYFVVANEGDDRDDFLAKPETERVKKLKLDPTAFPNAAALQDDGVLGRLTVFSGLGDTDNDGDLDRLYALGGRSFSIYNAATGEQVYDSGSVIEEQVYASYSADLLKAKQVQGRLDNKGPEPESVVIGEVRGVTYAFVGLERASAVAVFDVSNPQRVRFVRLLRNSTTLSDGDISPEGLQFISAQHSHTGKAMLLVGHEVSGSLAVYALE